MALSGSFDWSVTAADVIQGALEKVKAVISGETVDTNDQSLALRELNRLIKQWSHPGDNSPGMKVWLRKIIYLFQIYGTREYYIGPSAVTGANRCALSYSSTTISAAEALGQTVLSVTSTTGMTAADIIGIELDDGTLQWTSVVSTGAGPTVTVTDALTAAASAGNAVFWYTTATGLVQFRPLEILTALLRDLNNQDTPMSVYFRNELPAFEEISDKTARADATALFAEPQRQLMKITLDSAASDVSKVLRMICLSPADDLDTVNDDLCFPPEWAAALEWELAKRIATSFSYVFTNTDSENWTQATSIARQVNPRGFEGGYMPEDADEDSMTL